MIAPDFVSHLLETEDTTHTAGSTVYESAPETVTLVRFEDAIQGLNLPPECDLLSIDVEGHELSVLKSIDFAQHTFRAIVIETHLINSDGSYKWRHRDLEEIEGLLLNNDYKAVHRPWVNTICLHSQRVSQSDPYRFRPDDSGYLNNYG